MAPAGSPTQPPSPRPGSTPGSPAAGSLTVRTLAPGGGLKVKFDPAGLPKLSEVKPIWKAGLDEPRAKTCSRNGR